MSKKEIYKRVKTSNLLGKNKNLVLHGGGNTSVKITEKNIFGENEKMIYVKGSGWDLETITSEGFSAVKLEPLIELSKLSSLSDTEMVNQLKLNMKNTSDPTPSVEAILHAIIPHKYVDHTHADSFIAISNSINGDDIIKNLYGDNVIIVPYVMPGFDLAKLAKKYLDKYLNEDTIGMLLLNHGVFSFGETAEESYERMLDLVKIADEYLSANTNLSKIDISTKSKELNLIKLSELRKSTSEKAQKPLLLMSNQSNDVMSFCYRTDLDKISQSGPATPDHVIRTKRIPMLGRDIDKYDKDYKKYFKRNKRGKNLEMLDPAPRVILDKEFGLCTAGKNTKDCKIIEDIYTHTIKIINQSSQLGGYKALSESEIFDVEYWELEQAKLKNKKKLIFDGIVVVVTGAANGIGRQTVDSYLENGATVVGLDINNEVKSLNHPNYLGIKCDLVEEKNVKKAIDKVVLKFGGLDFLILNAGIFPPSELVAEINFETWKNVFSINLDANLHLLKYSFNYLKNSVLGNANIIFVGSKNVKAPGIGVSAYSSSKAALTQLARVVALEWGKYNINVNIIHPNAVFDTKIWNEKIIKNRAKNYNMSVEDYKKNNILNTEISSKDVSNLILKMTQIEFSKTTGSQVTIDGGNERVI